MVKQHGKFCKLCNNVSKSTTIIVASCESFEDESAKTTGDTRIQTIENASATDHTNNGYAVHGDLA